MFRKSLLGAVVAVFALGTASVASAQPPFPQFPQPLPRLPQPQPQPFPNPQPFPFPNPQPFPRLPAPHDHHFHVQYRTCDHVPWRSFGTFDSHDEAHDVVRMLRRKGFEARVIHH